MTRAIRIRNFLPSDGVICHRLRRSAFNTDLSGYLTPEQAQIGANSYCVAEFSERIGGMETYVATIDSLPIGFLTVRVDSPIRAEVLYLYIAFRHRGEGIGSALTHYAEQRLMSFHPDLAVLYLDTVVPDYNQGFWENMGYRYVGPSTCNNPAGNISAVHLEKTIEGNSD